MSNVEKIKLFPYQERVIEEKEDLNYKIEKLNRVIIGISKVEVTIEESKRMKNQVLAMRLYSNILQARIDAWEAT